MINRKIKPEPKGKVKLNLPVIIKSRLPNSVLTYYVQKDTLPIIQINLIIPSGSIYDGATPGLSSLTSMLIDEAAGDLTGLEISEKLDYLGSILNINSNKEFTTFSIISLEEHLEESLEIFSKIIISPVFNESDFSRERERLNAQLLNFSNDPAYLASTELNRIIYDKTPYRFPANGLTSSLNELKNIDIKSFYKKRYFPNGTFLIGVGSLGEDQFISVAEKYFSDWNSSGNNHYKSFNLPYIKKRIVLLDKPDAAQSELRIGHPAKGRKSNDFYSRTVLNSVIGGQFSSRINLNLREDKGITYGAHSRYIYNQIGSTYLISTAVKSEATVLSINEIFNELESVKTNLTKKEVEFSKSYLIRSYPSLFETYSQIATNISLLPIYKLEEEYFKEYTENIGNVKIEEVSAAAIENLRTDNTVIVVVGKKDILKKDLMAYALKNDFDFIESSTEI